MPRDKRVPMVFGTTRNIPPVFVDGTFCWNDGKVDSAVFYLNGRRLDNPIVDYPDLLSLMTAKVPTGTYATCSAYAAIKFGERHDGILTADVANTNAGMFLPPEEPAEILPPPQEQIGSLFVNEEDAQAEVDRRGKLMSISRRPPASAPEKNISKEQIAKIIAKIIADELSRQVQEGRYPIGGYVDDVNDNLSDVIIDGHFDLLAVASAVRSKIEMILGLLGGRPRVGDHSADQHEQRLTETNSKSNPREKE